MKRLPLIVGFGGYNAAGRSSGHNGYKRMIFESLSNTQKASLVQSLASLMGVNLSADTENIGDEALQRILNGTLVRKIEPNFFDVDRVPTGKMCRLAASEDKAVVVRMSARDLPSSLPLGWTVLGEERGFVDVEIWKEQTFLLDSEQQMPVQAAGQLPSGFKPGSYYKSTHHPRGLQLSILAASDAVKSMGIDWQSILAKVAPDQIAVYSSSVMSQLDSAGFGGMLNARKSGTRVSSKQLALGLNTMPADFVNAYVLGSVGATGGVTGACATFLYNLRAGAEEIQSGRRRVVLVGSSEAPILPEVIDGYAAMSALATDADLRKLHGNESIDYRRASRPFGENCGFTIAESGQYVVLMDHELALELGAQIYAAVPGVFVHADGYKKSISSPGPGNYITMAKAVALAAQSLGEARVRQASFVQAHGSSTPQNRTTESRIIDRIAQTFGISQWPVSAVKAYVGHSLGPASGDQLAATLGVFAQGILPGIKTIDGVAEDVFSERLSIATRDTELGPERAQVAFLNSKGFGGNNATATLFAPAVVEAMLQKHVGSRSWGEYLQRKAKTQDQIANYESAAQAGKLDPVYEFGSHLIDEEAIDINALEMRIPGFEQSISLTDLKPEWTLSEES